LNGKQGQAYTLANKTTFCSIRETAEMVAEKIAKNKIKVVFNITDPREYAQNLNLDLNLNTDKAEALGWKAEINLEETYRRTIESMKIKSRNNFFEKL
jgi:nucleoside-diphosphate-sugar epimerase